MLPLPPQPLTLAYSFLALGLQLRLLAPLQGMVLLLPLVLLAMVFRLVLLAVDRLLHWLLRALRTLCPGESCTPVPVQAQPPLPLQFLL